METHSPPKRARHRVEEINLIVSKSPYVSVARAAKVTGLTKRQIRYTFRPFLRRIGNEDFLMPGLINEWILTGSIGAKKQQYCRGQFQDGIWPVWPPSTPELPPLVR